jgi:hypothetical protein
MLGTMAIPAQDFILYKEKIPVRHLYWQEIQMEIHNQAL